MTASKNRPRRIEDYSWRSKFWVTTVVFLVFCGPLFIGSVILSRLDNRWMIDDIADKVVLPEDSYQAAGSDRQWWRFCFLSCPQRYVIRSFIPVEGANYHQECIEVKRALQNAFPNSEPVVLVDEVPPWSRARLTPELACQVSIEPVGVGSRTEYDTFITAVVRSCSPVVESCAADGEIDFIIGTRP